MQITDDRQEETQTFPALTREGRFPSERCIFLILVGLGLAVLYVGWSTFWFMTDDAFIAFRYVDNGMRGFGYVWNPPPFLPVEGYTSFLWVVVLEMLWRVTGLEPPQTANWAALFFGCLTLVVSADMAFRTLRTFPGRWSRHALLALFLAYLVLNRSFLAWTSSGLETAMFDFFLILWTWRLNFGDRTTLNWWAVSAVSALLALTRPDGLLFAAATFGVFFLAQTLCPRAERLSWKSFLWICSPFTVVITHLLWRRSFYGEWLPNTYYAKVSEAQPYSGAIYAFSFLLEFCVWPILAIVGVALLAFSWRTIRRVRAQSGTEERHAALRRALSGNLFLVGTGGAFALHFLYYTLIVGGDHFEYRPYNHLFPLIFLSLICGLRELRLRPAIAVLAAAFCLAVSLPVPVTHWLLTRSLNARPETTMLAVPISPAWPRYLRWYSRRFDKCQPWLIGRLICCRHQEHKVFSQRLLADLPSRREGQKMQRSEFPVFVTRSVGVAGWVLPEAFVVDSLGLNDYVVARAPVPSPMFGGMAHSRQAPEGYVEDFRANVTCDVTGLHVVPRSRPLTEADIVRIESKWRKWVRDRTKDD